MDPELVWNVTADVIVGLKIYSKRCWLVAVVAESTPEGQLQQGDSKVFSIVV